MNELNYSCLFSSCLRDVSNSLSNPAGLMQNPIINISFQSISNAEDAGGERLVVAFEKQKHCMNSLFQGSHSERKMAKVNHPGSAGSAERLPFPP